MRYRWLEEWYDMLLYVLFIPVSLIFFLFYWSGEYRLRCAEAVIISFLDEVSAEGEIDEEIYGELTKKISKINIAYEWDVYAVKYELKPVYDYVSEEKLSDYFMMRNRIKEKKLEGWKPESGNISADTLFYQNDTNASLWAAEYMEGLPLPEEEEIEYIEAVRPFQEVYEGEELITLCKVVSGGKTYYLQAESLFAEKSGKTMMNIVNVDKVYSVPIEVICHPRFVQCENGHEVVNTKEIIMGTKKMGKVNCSLCAQIPENVTCNTYFLRKQTGTVFNEEDIILTVTYMNGNIETITPMSPGWQDTYDEEFCGLQSVYVSYRGVSQVITVLAENKTCRKCGGRCNERNKTDYDMFPYCTVCMSQTALFTGDVYEKEIQIGIGKIPCFLERGDLLVVKLLHNGKCISILQKEIKMDGEEK